MDIRKLVEELDDEVVRELKNPRFDGFDGFVCERSGNKYEVLSPVEKDYLIVQMNLELSSNIFGKR